MAFAQTVTATAFQRVAGGRNIDQGSRVILHRKGDGGGRFVPGIIFHGNGYLSVAAVNGGARYWRLRDKQICVAAICCDDLAREIRD